MSKIEDSCQELKIGIEVKNFGPISEANIDLRPLTVFVGPSNTGKTYLATLIYVLHGVFNDFTGPNLIYNSEPSSLEPFLRGLFNGQDLLKEEKNGIQRKMSMIDRLFLLSDLPKSMHESILDYLNIDSFRKALQEELINCFNLDSISNLNRVIKKQQNPMSISLKIESDNKIHWNISMHSLDQDKSDLYMTYSSRDAEVLIPKNHAITIILPEHEGKSEITIVGRRSCRYFLPGARSGLMQSHRVIAGSMVRQTTRIGVEELSNIPTMSSVLTDFLAKIILYEENKNIDSDMHYIAGILENNILQGEIKVKSSVSGNPDVRYTLSESEKDIPLSQSSSMVIELAPVVLFIKGILKPGDTLIIEEPEAHLHPGAQADMAVILAHLVRAGVRVIATTHSDWLLQEIGNLVLEGLIDENSDESDCWLVPEEVGVWHFQKNKIVKEIPFKSIEGISPQDYEDVAEGLYNRTVNLQQRYERKKGKSRSESN